MTPSDLPRGGIVSGFDSQTFGPTRPVTRQQFAKMVVLTLDLPVSESLTCAFTDVVHEPGERSITSTDVIDELIRLMKTQGIPEHIR